MDSKPKTPGVDSARRALQVLMLFTETTPILSVEQMVRMLQIAPASVYRYLGLLREMALVEETSYRHYALSARALSIGRAAEAASPLDAAIRPVLTALSAECGEVTLLMRRIGDSAIAADVTESPNPIRISFQTGQPLALHRGAGAKVLLAGMGQEWVSGYCNRALGSDDGSVRSALLAETARITSRGWAESASEVDDGIWAVAVPIHSGDRTLASISVAGPQYRLKPAQMQRIRERLLETADSVNRAIHDGTIGGDRGDS